MTFLQAGDLIYQVGLSLTGTKIFFRLVIQVNQKQLRVFDLASNKIAIYMLDEEDTFAKRKRHCIIRETEIYSWREPQGWVEYDTCEDFESTLEYITEVTK